MRSTRFQIAKKDVISYFESLPQNIYSYTDIANILEEKKEFWRLPVSLSTRKFIELLCKSTGLKAYYIDFPNRGVSRFAWVKISSFNMALSLMEHAYFTHYTAVFLNNLTEQEPRTIYTNFEQPKKTVKRSDLPQKNIDLAFSRAQRISKNIAPFGDYKICLLNGRFTGELGVVELEISPNEKVRATNVERTLIDIVVRPAYSGGVAEVLNAYRRAKGRVSINSLTAMLKKLNYIYPYHQAIGFYLERAGVYSSSEIKLLKGINMTVDFYLTHKMKDTEYSKEWKLYYPKGF